MAERTASVTEPRTVGVGPVVVRWTAPDALSNLVAVLELVVDGRVRCNATSRQPYAATVKLIEDALVAGDFYDSGDPIAAFAWPLLIQVGGLARLAGLRARTLPARPRDAGQPVLRGARRAVGQVAGGRIDR